MQPEPNAKQLIVERIKSTTNILVTVSRNPSVDELSAALGLTLMLNKMDKHATAVFSGAVPPAIEFLEPKKTFEHSTDSLRDFIIALDKEKADRLRYKVEEDVVRIFITPYRTTITDKDLNFSQGDFNVELIIALGVEKREDIDTAVTAHGRILHDATVVTVNTKAEKSSVSAIDWSDPSASSLCEMLMSLSEALQSGLLDQQMSTALLTGIVSATDRFRNEHTSPKVMTMAAQLTAAGANQQLIATKLEESHELEEAKSEESSDGSTHLKEGESEKVSKKETTPKEEEPPKPKNDGEMTIVHKKDNEEPAPSPKPEVEPEPEPEPTPEPEPQVEPEEPKKPEVEEPQDAEAELAAQLDAVTPPAANDLREDLLAVGEAVTEKPDSLINNEKGSWRDRPTAAPAFGGTLNATVAHENDRPQDGFGGEDRTILSHSPPVSSMPPQFDQLAPQNDEPVDTNPLAETIKSEPDSLLSYEPIPEPHETPQTSVAPVASAPPAPVAGPSATLSELEAQAQASATGNVDDARAAVDAALSALPFNPAGQPLQSVGAQPLGGDIRGEAQPVASPFTQPQPQAAPAVEPMPTETPSFPAAPPPAPGMPPLPDFSTLPPLPGQEQQPPHPAMTDPSLSQDAVVTVPTDPAQFKIPGSN